MANEEPKHTGIWLEVSEVSYGPLAQTSETTCCVILKADKEHPKPIWWPVANNAAGNKALDTYKAILNEMDKKRVVLAWLTWDAGKKSLHCNALRFQSAEMSSR